MSFHSSTRAVNGESALWRALTRLDGFEFSREPELRGDELKNFGKTLLHKASWKHLTQEELATYVTTVFQAAYAVYQSDDDSFSDASFYGAVAKKLSRSKSKSPETMRCIVGTYVDGLKRVAARSESCVYVNRRTAQAALSVASWIELTEGMIISITTKPPMPAVSPVAPVASIPPESPMKAENGPPPPQQSRKRRGDVVDDASGRGSAQASEVRLEAVKRECDQAYQELKNAKTQIDRLTRQGKATEAMLAFERDRVRDAKRVDEARTTELARAKAKQKKFHKALRAAQRNQQEIIENLKNQHNNQASAYFASAEAERGELLLELVVVKCERNAARQKLKNCARIIKYLDSRLNGESGGESGGA